MSTIYGIYTGYHSQSIALVKDGEIIIIEISDYINEVPIITDEEELKIAIINHFKK